MLCQSGTQQLALSVRNITLAFTGHFGSYGSADFLLCSYSTCPSVRMVLSHLFTRVLDNLESQLYNCNTLYVLLPTKYISCCLNECIQVIASTILTAICSNFYLLNLTKTLFNCVSGLAATRINYEYGYHTLL